MFAAPSTSYSTRWWTRRTLWLGLAITSAAPFLLARLPVMPDYFSHVGRYFVLLNRDDPVLASYYQVEWRLVGNLGVDLLVYALGQVMPVESAAHLATGLIPPLMVAGVYALARAVWGQVQAPALFALPLVYAMPLSFGFVNYWLSVALALLAGALWARLANIPPLVRVLIFLPISFLLWLCHMTGFGVFLVIAGALTLGEQWEKQGGRPAAALGQSLLQAAPLAWPLALVALWRSGAGLQAGGVNLKVKIFYLGSVLKQEWRWFDVASAALLYVALAALLTGALRGRARFRWPLLLAGGALGLFFMTFPMALFGSWYADGRLLAPALMLAFLALSVSSARGSQAIALFALGLFVVRIGATTWSWRERSRAMEAELAALKHVPEHARIAAFSSGSGCRIWVLHGYDHLPSLAIVRRRAFVNTQWDIAGSTVMRPVYNLGYGFNDNESSTIPGPDRRCKGEPLEARLRTLPRERFDFVWSFAGPAPAETREWLVPVARGERGYLYRVVHVHARPPLRAG